MSESVTRDELNTLVNNLNSNIVGTGNNITNNLTGTAINLQANQDALQEQILDLQKKNVLLGTFYYRLYDPETDKKNYANKSTIQYQNQDKTIVERDYESYRFGQRKLNGTNDKTLIIKITGSNTYTSSSSTIREDSNIKRFDTETIEIKDNQDLVIGTVIYSDGIIENSITNVVSLKFVCLGGTGRYRNANYIIINYMNNHSFDSTNKNLYPREILIYS